MPIMDDSIILRVEFRNFANEYDDPSTITLKIYDSYKKQIGSTIDVGVLNKKSKGIYEVVYTLPSIDSTTLPKQDGKLYAEFKGVLEGSNIVSRIEFNRKWI